MKKQTPKTLKIPVAFPAERAELLVRDIARSRNEYGTENPIIAVHFWNTLKCRAAFTASALNEVRL